jgi:flagellar motor switch protein FliM
MSGALGQLRRVDFSQPTKFTGEHQRRITRALEGFCETAGSRLSAVLRSPVELELTGTTQLTWSAAQAQLAPESLALTLEVDPIGTHLLLCAEHAFVVTGLECLLGGSPPDGAPEERRLSEIDCSVARGLLESVARQLSSAFQELAGVSLEARAMQIHDEPSPLAPASEPTFVVTLTARFGERASVLTLLLPWTAIDAVEERICGREPGATPAGHGRAPGVGGAMSAVSVTLRAEVARVELPVEEILALTPGSIVRLGTRAADGISLYAEDVMLGRAIAGRNGARRAVQIRGAASGVT